MRDGKSQVCRLSLHCAPLACSALPSLLGVTQNGPLHAASFHALPSLQRGRTYPSYRAARRAGVQRLAHRPHLSRAERGSRLSGGARARPPPHGLNGCQRHPVANTPAKAERSAAVAVDTCCSRVHNGRDGGVSLPLLPTLYCCLFPGGTATPPRIAPEGPSHPG